MGVSENSVPLNPMVLLIIIPIKWLFHWEYTLFSDKPIFTEEIDQEPWEKTRGCPLIFRQGCGLWVSSGANGSTVDLDVFSVSICIYIETSDI